MNKKKLLSFMLFTVLIFAFSFIKVSFFAGSHNFFFSGVNLVFPVLGSLLGTTFSGLAVLLFFLFKKITLGGAMTLGLPTMFATLAFSVMTKKNKNKSVKLEFYDFLLRVVLPLLAIILFVFNSVGKQSFLYSFYWFIPVGLYFFERINNNSSLFLKSLATTFIAHAVGSFIWLYLIPTTSVYWISLIPVVLVERIIFALGISLVTSFLKSINCFFMHSVNLKLKKII
jgi:hypothetical protein